MFLMEYLMQSSSMIQSTNLGGSKVQKISSRCQTPSISILWYRDTLWDKIEDSHSDNRSALKPEDPCMDCSIRVAPCFTRNQESTSKPHQRRQLMSWSSSPLTVCPDSCNCWFLDHFYKAEIYTVDICECYLIFLHIFLTVNNCAFYDLSDWDDCWSLGLEWMVMFKIFLICVPLSVWLDMDMFGPWTTRDGSLLSL